MSYDNTSGLTATLQDWLDKLNPIMIKESRQAINGRLFFWGFLSLILIGTIVTVVSSLDAWLGNTININGADIFLYFYGPVEEKRNLALLRALHAASRVALERCDWPDQARVYLYINSSGGDAYAGLGAMDQIRLNRVPIVAIAEGFVASAATFMLLGAHERKAMTHAKVLIHQLSTGFWGKYNDLLDEIFDGFDNPDCAIRLWDGSLWGPDPERARATLELTHPGSLRQFLAKPTQAHLAECYMRGVVDVAGYAAGCDLLYDLEQSAADFAAVHAGLPIVSPGALTVPGDSVTARRWRSAGARRRVRH